jgi:hypothetical protein
MHSDPDVPFNYFLLNAYKTSLSRGQQFALWKDKITAHINLKFTEVKTLCRHKLR